MSYIVTTLGNLIQQTAFFGLSWGNYLMVVVALVFLYLAIKKEITTSKEIGAAMGIPKNYVLKITHKLVEAGIIERLVGAQGGFSLAQKIDDITLLDILNIMEPTMRVNRCLEEDKFCSRYATENCPVRGFYCKLQEELEKSLKKMTIKRLLADAN